MDILIRTEGEFENTHIFFNGEEISLYDFFFSIHPNGRPKAQYKTINENKKMVFVSLYGGDFQKFSETIKDAVLMGQKNEKGENQNG